MVLPPPPPPGFLIQIIDVILRWRHGRRRARRCCTIPMRGCRDGQATPRARRSIETRLSTLNILLVAERRKWRKLS